jgi:hypothetical protein
VSGRCALEVAGLAALSLLVVVVFGWAGFGHGGKGPDDADGSEAVVLDLASQRTPVYSR